MAFPDDYWASYEHRVYSLPSFLQAVRNISAFEAASDARFVWRGVKNASWGLHSRLFRAYQGAHGETPTERQLRAFEQQVLVEAREWGLDWHIGTSSRPSNKQLDALAEPGPLRKAVDPAEVEAFLLEEKQRYVEEALTRAEQSAWDERMRINLVLDPVPVWVDARMRPVTS
jgi:hypothetical protein